MKFLSQQFCPVSRCIAVICILITLFVIGPTPQNATGADEIAYTATQIPDGRVASALNNVGQIVGMKWSPFGGNNQPISWHHQNQGALVAAPTIRNNFSCASSINDRGQVAGTLNGETVVIPFIWTPGGKLLEMLVPSGYNGGEAFRINTAGDVVGYVCGRAGVRACVWTKGTNPRELEPLPDDTYSRAFAVNDSGAIVGVSGGRTARHAVLWTKGRGARDLGTLPGYTSSEAVAINKNTSVVGVSKGPKGWRAFLWNGRNGLQDLGALPGYNNSEAYDINDSGAVVGNCSGAKGSRAFIWTPKAGMRDLNSGISPDAGVVLISAFAINRKGQIMTRATNRRPPCEEDETGACAVDECAPFPKYSFLLTPSTATIAALALPVEQRGP